MIDLHMHSRYSDDGELEPGELVRQCAEAGIRIMAITDHNCTRAYREALRSAVEGEREISNMVSYGIVEVPDTGGKKIMIIPGTEIDCVWRGINFHLLGYGIDSNAPDFRKIENDIAVQSADASLQMLHNTQKLGFYITKEEMWQLGQEHHRQDCWTGEMFAEVLLDKEEYRDHPLLAPYRPGGMRSDNPYVNFYWDYYAQGKPCHVEMHYPALEEMIDVIHRNHGTAVLAHPGMNLKGKEERIREMFPLGLDGVEAFSSYHTKEQTACFYREARKAGLGLTCGSDFHGKTKPAIRLGGINFGAADERAEFEDEVIRFLQEKALTDAR